MKILYVDQYFSTREGISGTRSYEFARRWVRKGHQVTVLCSATQYAGRAEAEQRRFLEGTTVDGIKVWSLKIGYSSRMGYARRAVSFLAFLVLGTLVGLAMPRADIVFATSTPLTVGIPGYLISLIRGGRFVFEVRDLWPEAPVQIGVLRNPLLIDALRFLEAFLYRRARHIIALSPGINDGIAASGTAPNKITMIPNACDLDLMDEAEPAAGRLEELGLSGKFVVLYAGAIGPANDLGYLLDVADATGRMGNDRMHYLVIGDGPHRSGIESEARRRGLSNLTFLDAVPRREVAGLIRACDATLTLFADVPVLATNSPNKLFDYLGAGKPALVNSDGWMRQLVEESGAGFYLSSRDPAGAAERIGELSRDPQRTAEMGRAARTLGESRFARPLLADEMEGALREVVEQFPIQGGLGTLLKRTVDLIGAGLVLSILWPFFLIIGWAIRRETPGPAFYRQQRAGRGGKVFRVFKFRTMVSGAERMGLGLNVEAGDERLTRVGRFLREWSLDELPQVLNVFLGHMNLVGPRPPIPSQVERYSDEQRRRLQVKPGITGWAQVNGRNALSWSRRIELDLWYVEHVSFWLDLRIMLRTPGLVLGRQGLYEPDGGVDDEFNRFE